MTHDDDPMLMAYADGELDREAAEAVERRLATDARARATVGMYRETAALLRAACGEAVYAAGPAPRPSHLVAPRRPLARRAFLGPALAASVMAALGFAGGRAWHPGRSAFLDEIAEYHEMFAAEPLHLIEVPANRPADLALLLGPDNAPPVPDLSGSGLHLAGGRLLAISEERVVQLMYTRASGPPVGLCVVRRPRAPAAAVAVSRRGDLRLADWQAGEHGFVVVGELDEPALLSIAAEVRRQVG